MLVARHAFGQQFTKTTLETYPHNFAQAFVASWGDFNNDNHLDIFSNRLYKNYLVLYMNNGDGTFRVDSSIAVEQEIQSRLRFGALADYDNDGHLDLFSTRGGQYDKSVLYHNNGNGTFSRITDHPLVDDCCTSSFHSAWADYDNDGDVDGFIVNWGLPSFLFRNDGKGNFTKITQGAFAQEESYSNGASWGDFNNDGYLDLLVTNSSTYRKPASNFLYRNNGNGSFTRITTGAIVTDTTDAHGSAWGDYDNDGHLDLFVANHSKAYEAPLHPGYRNLLYHNNGNGTFTRITNNIVVADSSDSGGAAWGDADNNGDLDLFVANFSSPSLLFKNNGNNWLNIKLIGNASNKSAIGAVVRLKANGIWQMRHVEALSGTLSQNSLNVEFGLGKAAVIDSIRVQWPSGSKSMMSGIAINQFLTVEEDDVKNEPLAIVVADSSDCSSQKVVLKVDGVYDKYLWQDGSTNPSLVVQESGVYTVVASRNCRTLTATKEVKVVERKPLLIPNVITPNGDNYNDFFIINDWLLGAGVEIYNRWGKQVCKSENYQNEWQAEYLPNGIYFYQLKHSCLPKSVKGWISVLR